MKNYRIRVLTNCERALKRESAWTSRTHSEIPTGCSERPSNKAAAREEANRTL